MDCKGRYKQQKTSHALHSMSFAVCTSLCSRERSRYIPLNPKVFRSTERNVRREREHLICNEAQAGQTFAEQFEDDACLHTSKRCAETKMNAFAESQVRFGVVTTNVEDVRVHEAFRVTVRRSEQQEQSRSLGNGDAADFGRSCRDSSPGNYRGIEAQHLFHGVRNQHGIGTQSVPCFRMYEQLAYCICNEVSGSLMTGEREAVDNGGNLFLADCCRICIVDVQEATGEVIGAFTNTTLDKVLAILPVSHHVLRNSHLLIGCRPTPGNY